MAEDCDGLEDDGDDEHTVPLPSIAERTRSSIARRIAAVRLLANGGGSVSDLDAADADVEREAAVDTELGWAEHIKQQYDAATAVMRAWRRFWMRFSRRRASWRRRKSATCIFEAGRGALAPDGAS